MTRREWWAWWNKLEPAWPLWIPTVVVLFVAIFIGRTAHRYYSQGDILEALVMIESGGRADPPDGDGGRAIGPLQIHEIYWTDAVLHDPELGGTYQDCRDLTYAERVVHAYMSRWAPAAWRDGDAEIIARVHNGGPTGPQKAATLPYWRKVRAYLARNGGD